MGTKGAYSTEKVKIDNLKDFRPPVVALRSLNGAQSLGVRHDTLV